MIGSGPSATEIREVFKRDDLGERLHFAGELDQPLLASAYCAMDVFAFASKSETQGMVLTEALAAGVPVIALDAPGVREVVRDGYNGRLLDTETTAAFCAALAWFAELPANATARLSRHAQATAREFSIERSVERALALCPRRALG